MAELPSGTVTFLFTDIEGSTRLLHQLGAARYAEALAEHRRVLRKAFAQHGGVEVDTQGDAFFVAFPTASGALAAASDASAALASGPVHVRIGVHTGEPLLTGEGYVGRDVHKAARIAAAGHGGQVVVSDATRLAAGVDLRSLGQHRLKDLAAPEQLWQLGEGTFPPLKSLNQTNLPVQPSPLVGRQQELELGGRLLREHRLVTLVGAGGSGKTRLALQLASEAVEAFPQGVWWVPLQGLRDAELVESTIANALGAKAELIDHLAGKRLLLLLDNFEHLIGAANVVAAILAGTEHVHLLVTSREPLRIAGESVDAVEPLPNADAVALFLARATQVEPRAAVEEICRRLDGLPLAIELAAARTALLAPDQLLARLDQRLSLLTGGRRDAPDRQRTLRATIEWSHDLLDEAEQQLFRRLAVFAGSFDTKAAEDVCDASLDGLQSLLERSLLRRWGFGRLAMLETIREYANERLDASGETEARRHRHAQHFLALAERAAPKLVGRGQADSLELLEQEYPNLQAALAWWVPMQVDANGARLAGALTMFWARRGYFKEGRRWLAAVLAAGAANDDPTHTMVLADAGLLASLQGDWAESKRLSEECRRLCDERGDAKFGARSRMVLARIAAAEGDHDHASGLLAEAVALAREADDPSTGAVASFNLGYGALSAGNYERAKRDLEAALERFIELDNSYFIARSLAALGAVALHERRTDDAIALLRRSLEESRPLGDRDDMAWAIQLMGIARSVSDPQRAARMLGAAESLRDELGLTLQGAERDLHDRALAAMDGLATAAAWAAGRALPTEQAVEEALAL